MSNSKRLIIDTRILRVLEISYPDLIAKAQNDVTPLMNNLVMITEVYDYVCLNYQPQSDYTHKLLFIASILRLFNPDALIIDCKLRNGLRKSLADCLGDSGSNSSFYVSQARHYMKIKSFKDSVASITEQYLNQMPVA